MASDWLYQRVRVTCVLRAPHEYDGWRLNQRPPYLGDTGYVVDVIQAPDLPTHYVVESSHPDGTTIWLAEFTADELELADDV